MGRVHSPSAVARPGSRPILNIGIALCALVVVSLVVLVCTLADPLPGSGQTSLQSLASMVLAYVLPCVAALVVVIMRDVAVPRPARYAMAAVSFGVLCILAAFPVLGLIAVPGTETSRQLDLFSSDIVRRGAWVFVLLGLMMGFSLPVSTRAKDAPARTAPNRLNIQLTCLGLLWACLAIQIAYAIIATSGGVFVMGPAVTFVVRSSLVPFGAFLAAASVSCWAWTFTSFGYPPWLSKVLFWAPLAVMAYFFVSDLADVASLHATLSIDFNNYRISEVGIVYTSALGVFFGVGVSAVDDD